MLLPIAHWKTVTTIFNKTRMKKFLFTIIFFMSAIVAFAQEAPATEVATAITTNDIITMIVVGLLVFIVLVLCYMIYIAVGFIQALKGDNPDAVADNTPIIDFTKAVPIERESEIMFDHEYDGIRELDNQLPPWWVYMFYATIVFAVVYMWYYHINQDGNVQDNEYKQELVDAEIIMKQMAEKVNENTATLLTDESRLAKGAELFQQNCKACHGANGEGTVGPNLTDDYWLHGGDIKDIFKTVKYGVPQKGMIAWQAQLSASQIQEVASYIVTLRGTNPANPKDPQGELVGQVKGNSEQNIIDSSQVTGDGVLDSSATSL
jgi:cytochrome c oxidase cbb3-type subunit III